MKNKKPPIPTVINDRTSVSATITKVSDVTNTKSPIVLDNSNTVAVSNSISDKISSNEEILQLFPDVELAIQILVSSILSPNDMLNAKLNYSMDDFEIPNSINAHILDVIRIHIEKNYALESKLSDILREALFTKGAYVEAIIPDTDILKLQKQLTAKLSTESIIDQMLYSNYLGPDSDVTLSVESACNNQTVTTETTHRPKDLLVSFIEDLDALRVPGAFSDTLSTEAMGNGTTHLNTARRSFKSFMRKTVSTDATFSVTTNNENGSPMSMKLPVESILPIHLTSDPSKHISYLVILDENGVPIHGTTKLSDALSAGDGKITRDIDVKTSIINKAASSLKTKLSTNVVIDDVDNIYTKALLSSIRNKVQTGRLGNTVDIPEYSDVYQTVFTRALKGLKTRILFVPKENLNYFAFEYRENGTGKSLLEKSVMLFSIRAANLFTRIMANVKNSVTTTKVSAVLDSTDPDPEHTKEMIISHAMKSERVKYPIGMTNVRDLVDWMHNVGYRFDIKHPALPEIEIDISEDNRNIAEPDTDFDDMIQEHIIMSFGLKKDMVLAGYESDFATTVVANNALFAKRVMEHQNKFTPQVSGYVKKVLLNDGLLKAKVIDIISSNLVAIRKMLKKSMGKDDWETHKEFVTDDVELADYIYYEYAASILVTLPKVDTNSEEGSLDGLDAFVSMLDTYLPLIISSETFPQDLVGDISDKMEDIMAAIRTILIKNWMDDRNSIPELTKFLTLDNTGRPRYDILEEYNDFTQTLAKAIIPHLKELKKDANKLDAKLEKIDSGELDNTDDTPVDEAPVDDTPVDEVPVDDTSVDEAPVDDTTQEEL